MEQLVQALSIATSAKKLSDIHSSYLAIVAKQRVAARAAQAGTPTRPGGEQLKSSPIPSPLAKEDFIAVLDALGSSGRPADVKMITDIANDMPTDFGVAFTMDIHDAILRAFVRNGHVQSACKWLQTMPRKSGHHIPTLAQWHFFLESVENGTLSESFKYMRNAIKLHMRPSGCPPSTETYKILIRARWKTYNSSHPHPVVFKTLIDDMKNDGLPHDASVAAFLYDKYAERGLLQQAIEIDRYYHTQFPHILSSREQQEQRWNEWLADVAQSQGVKAAVCLFRDLQKEGCVASPSIFKAMLRYSTSSKDIKYLERELGMPTTVAYWSVIITNLCRAGNLAAALNIYKGTKSAGLRPDAALVGPIIRCLCQTTIAPPTDDAIEQALDIYGDLAQADLAQAEAENSEISSRHSTGPDVNIYQTLLRAFAVAPNPAKQFPKAISLLNDMQIRGLSLDDSIVATSTIVLLMRNSSNLDQAFSFYKRLCGSLDAKGYAIVLNAFCKLSFSSRDHLPSIPRYLEMLNDMRQAGHKMTPEVYTILLRQLAIVGTRMKRPDSPIPFEILPRLIAAVRRVHDHLTLDASISPDAHVLNQLMDTYQRLGCFGDACRVWEMMYLSGRFDSISVSIILDACGHAGSWKVAKQVCLQLSRDNFLFNQHNWNTWMECLCRLGLLNEAVKIACLEMGRNQEDVAPDIDTARILISFARKVNQQAEVSSRIQRYLPELWARLPEDLRTN